MSLPEILKNTRMKSLMSQDEFAKALSVSVGTINRWENGKTRPNITAMKHIRCFCSENNLSYESIEAEWLRKQGD